MSALYCYNHGTGTVRTVDGGVPYLAHVATVVRILPELDTVQYVPIDTLHVLYIQYGRTVLANDAVGVRIFSLCAARTPTPRRASPFF